MAQAPGLVSSTWGVKLATAATTGSKLRDVTQLVLGHDDELRATCLCFPATLAETHPLDSGGARGGDHTVGGKDRSRAVCEPGDNKRPIWAPDDQGTDRGRHGIKPGSQDGPVSGGWRHRDRLLLPRDGEG